MGAVNKVILVGNLGKDPEVRYTKAGQAVASFSLATSEKWTNKEGGKEEKTEWHRITAWGKLGEICGEYLSKGKQVYIEGRLQTRDWDDKDGNKKTTTEVVVSNMVMLGQISDGRGAGAAGAQHSAGSGGGADDFEDDDIPF